MSVKSILDTDILSEYLKGHNTIVASNAADYVEEHGFFTFTSVTVFEIVFGLEVKGAHSQLLRSEPGWTGTRPLPRPRTTMLPRP
jgi:predicted nucleic acid-binding protein